MTSIPAIELLAAAAATSSAERVVALGTGHGALPALLAQHRSERTVVACDISAQALELTREAARRGGLADRISVSDCLTLIPERAGNFGLATLALPKGRALSRRWLLEAHGLLRPGGTLLLAGANDEGIRTAISDAKELFGEVELLELKRRHRLARAIRQISASEPPAWSELPGVAPGSWHPLELQWEGRQYNLSSLPGIFSYDRLDPGTALLLSCAPKPNGRRVLDFGCGYGFIGTWAALHGAAGVDLTDINLWAALAARRNLAVVGAQNAEAFAGDGLDPVRGRRYHLVLANLPFHEGKEVSTSAATRFLEQLPPLLEPGGELVFVTNSFIRHDALVGRLFREQAVLRDNGRFRVMRASRAFS